MSAIKSCCVSDDVSLRVVSVETLTPLLLRVWCSLDSTPSPVEGRQQFESTVESRRHQEDMVEFIVDLFKNICLGVRGEAAGVEVGHVLVDNSRGAEACVAAMGFLLNAYNNTCNAMLQSMDHYASALLGQLPTSPSPPATGARTGRNIIAANSFVRTAHLDRLQAASLASLLQSVLPTLLKDPYLLFRRTTCEYS